MNPIDEDIGTHAQRLPGPAMHNRCIIAYAEAYGRMQSPVIRDLKKRSISSNSESDMFNQTVCDKQAPDRWPNAQARLPYSAVRSAGASLSKRR